MSMMSTEAQAQPESHIPAPLVVSTEEEPAEQTPAVDRPERVGQTGQSGQTEQTGQADEDDSVRSTADGPRRPGSDWTRRYPDRWRLELADLEATGWRFAVSAGNDGTPVLEVFYPLPSDPPGFLNTPEDVDGPETARLVVRFAAEAPFFPPSVFDPGNQLGLRRHRNPVTGNLCLIEEEDWRVDTTVAALLADQVPKLMRAGRGQVPSEPGIEVPMPEPVEAMLPRVADVAVLVPDDPIPPEINEGALVVRYSLRSGPGWLGTGIVERLLGPGLDLACPPVLPKLFPHNFAVVGYGRWARDPLFDPADTAAATYRRLQRQLQPLTVESEPRRPASSVDAAEKSGRLPEITPDEMEVLLLLVPSERGHRTAGEAWVAILHLPGDGEADCSQGHEDRNAENCGEADHERDREGGLCEYLQVQSLGPDSTRIRTPDVARLADRHVVLVGVGAVGGHVAEDLARSGIGHLDLVDGDHIEIATAARQYAPLLAAGRSKAKILSAHLALNQPFLNVRPFAVDIGARPHRPPNPRDVDPDRELRRGLERAGDRDRELAKALRTADLVIDASAAPAVTRYLAALRDVHHRDFLHVSATAGAWGGVVFLATPESGCWACLQHHRADGAVPVPPADPHGSITPPGCAEPTFTGTNADLATIAHHASRVAIQRLLTASDRNAEGGPVTTPTLERPAGLGGDLYVARLREDDGTPIPASWQAVPVPVHPDCPLNADVPRRTESAAVPAPTAAPAPAAAAAATAELPRTRTVGPQPPERTKTTPDEEADGPSPSGAPIPRTQQRKRTRTRHGHEDEAGQTGVQSEHEGGDRTRSRTPAPGQRSATTAETGNRDLPPGAIAPSQTGALIAPGASARRQVVR
jgi:molybdopterin/thiamine biosynthesis adenylyltransferase